MAEVYKMVHSVKKVDREDFPPTPLGPVIVG